MTYTGAVVSMASTSSTDATGRRDDEWSLCLLQVAESDRAAFAKLFKHFAPLIKAFALNGSAMAAAHAEELVLSLIHI